MGQWRPGPHGMLAVPCPWKSIAWGVSSPAWGLQGMESGFHPSPGTDQGRMILSTGLVAWLCLPAPLPQEMCNNPSFCWGSSSNHYTIIFQ